MKALIQRVLRGNVAVNDEVVGKIGRGYVVLLGIKVEDTEADARRLANKTINLRVFPDDDERMNLTIEDVGGEILVISQFTLYADTRKGNRPSFVRAAPAEIAETLYNTYVESLRQVLGNSRVVTGIFKSAMVVEIVNDGPVTVELSTDDK